MLQFNYLFEAATRDKVRTSSCPPQKIVLFFFISFHPCIFCQACSPSCGILSRNARDYLVHSSGAWKVVNTSTSALPSEAVKLGRSGWHAQVGRRVRLTFSGHLAPSPRILPYPLLQPPIRVDSSELIVGVIAAPPPACTWGSLVYAHACLWGNSRKIKQGWWNTAFIKRG